MESSKDKKASWEKMKAANVIAVIVIVFCGAYLLLLTFHEIPDKNRDLVIFLAGLFYGLLAALAHYFFNYNKKKDIGGDYFESNMNHDECPNCGQKTNENYE
ncbi:hypothetical protein [Altibacter sp. HG106]|uniref:hypothetical protein n=1 Tax=Altibacter sp. HG106 TaxID=3023937 RepID=UPI00234FE9EE|nr:hypothetical protein [Altibacter sp. HG106]MDC7994450.1 hypothetical protein [Altibacter sp. HG106]